MNSRIKAGSLCSSCPPFNEKDGQEEPYFIDSRQQKALLYGMTSIAVYRCLRHGSMQEEQETATDWRFRD